LGDGLKLALRKGLFHCRISLPQHFAIRSLIFRAWIKLCRIFAVGQCFEMSFATLNLGAFLVAKVVGEEAVLWNYSAV
jgi:hypothetical protein